MNQRIRDLVDEYPDVDLTVVPVDVLIDIAHAYLKAERAKLWESSPKSWARPDGATAVATLERQRVVQVRRQRERNTERIASDRAKVSAAVSNRINEITRTAAEKIVNEWAPALLAETFSLPDGSRTTWATATTAQHEARAAWLESTAQANVETASMHRRAVTDIRKVGAANLAGVAKSRNEGETE